MELVATEPSTFVLRLHLADDGDWESRSPFVASATVTALWEDDECIAVFRGFMTTEVDAAGLPGHRAINDELWRRGIKFAEWVRVKDGVPRTIRKAVRAPVEMPAP